MITDIIRNVRREGEKFLRALNGELYRNLAGFKPQSNLRDIYKSHSELGDIGLFFSIRDASREDEEQEKSLKLIRSLLTRFLLEGKTAKIRDEILTAESSEEILIDRRSMHFRSAIAEIKKEPKKSRRQEIYKQRGEKVSKLNPLKLRALEVMRGAASEIGFGSFTELCDETEGLDLNALGEKARLFLGDTEYTYRDLLKWFFLKRMELQLKDAKACDLSYLLNSFELRANFPGGDLRDLAKMFLGEMGIETGENIKTDLEARRGKASQAFCLPIEAPQNVMMSVYPISGIEDYESFFYELGVALSYGYAEREDVFEFRMLREAASSEIFGLLMQNVLFQPKWLRKYLQAETGSDFMNFLYLRRLTELRCRCAKLVYELSADKDEDFKHRPDHYRQTLKKATLCEHGEADYLNDISPFFHTASYLKACFIEAGLKLYLRDNFDEEWWREKAAGDFLRKLWKEGGRITSEEVSKRAGFEQLDSSPLLESFKEVFG